MARSLLEIILSVTDKNAKRELGALDKQLGQVDKAVVDSAKSVKNFGAGILTMGAVLGGFTAGVVATGKALYDIGKRGAIVEQTGQSFEFLTDKVGAAPDLLEKLRAETLGTVDDMTLMSSTMTLTAGASDELSQQLLENAPQLAKIAKAANKLNPALGDTAFLYESIGTGVKRASPLILDNLGLTIKIGEANEDMAKSLGKSVDELTNEERQMAILNATLEAGNVLIDQVGGNVEAAGDEFAILETQIANTKDELTKGFTPAISRALEVLNEFIAAQFEEEDVMQLFLDASEKGIISRERARTHILQLKDGLIDEAKAIEILENATYAWRYEMGLLDFQLVEAEGHEKAWILQHEEAVEAIEEVEEATRDFKQELSDLQLFIQGPLGKEYENFAEKQEDLRDEMIKVQDEIDELNGMEHLTDEQRQDLEEAKQKYDELGQKYKENADEHDEATKRIMFNILAQRAAIDGLTEREVEALTEIATNWGLVDQATADYVLAADEYFGTLESKTEENLGQVRGQLALTLGLAQENTTQFGNMRDAIAQIEGIHEVGIHIRVTGDPIPKVPTTKPGEGYPKYQHGGSFIVPPGFPNDTFPFLVSSGERVTVTPRGVTPGVTPFNRRGGGRGEQPLPDLSVARVVYIRGGDNVFIQNEAAAAYLVEKQYQSKFAEIDKVI